MAYFFLFLHYSVIRSPEYSLWHRQFIISPHVWETDSRFSSSPSRRSLYSRRESLLSRRSCFSISSLILRASLASGLRQQAPTGLRVITPGYNSTFQGRGEKNRRKKKSPHGDIILKIWNQRVRIKPKRKSKNVSEQHSAFREQFKPFALSSSSLVVKRKLTLFCKSCSYYPNGGAPGVALNMAKIFVFLG